MKKVKLRILTLGIFSISGFAAYQLLLTAEAKEQAKKTVKTIAESFVQIKNLIEARQGIVVEESCPENIKRTQAQWEKLGF
ncbi:hypothetical protein [uncultured Olegusella sp.]|uniref:hypothetical protein n=1 Tax=uncultured Olegusella sp. TaxID=1979846 RepID=UPI00262FCC63|nr:hypothetical protein [uncultured Olegusella sp.]